MILEIEMYFMAIPELPMFDSLFYFMARRAPPSCALLP